MDERVVNVENKRSGLENPEYEALNERALGTNVNPQTLLATDYLNHFNEVIMLIGMVPDMPEMLEDVREWQPKSYQDHFRDSSIADKELAIEAYEFVPDNFKDPFDKTIQQLNDLVATTLARLEMDLDAGNLDLARENAASFSRTLQRLVDVAGGIIHGSESSLMDQTEIDALLSI